jgi:hypothetical protein
MGRRSKLAIAFARARLARSGSVPAAHRSPDAGAETHRQQVREHIAQSTMPGRENGLLQLDDGGYPEDENRRGQQRLPTKHERCKDRKNTVGQQVLQIGSARCPERERCAELADSVRTNAEAAAPGRGEERQNTQREQQRTRQATTPAGPRPLFDCGCHPWSNGHSARLELPWSLRTFLGALAYLAGVGLIWPGAVQLR